MSRIESGISSDKDKQESTKNPRPPKYRACSSSIRATDTEPGDVVKVFPVRQSPFSAIVLGEVKTPKQPSNQLIEITGLRHGVRFRIGSGTSVLKTDTAPLPLS